MSPALGSVASAFRDSPGLASPHEEGSGARQQQGERSADQHHLLRQETSCVSAVDQNTQLQPESGLPSIQGTGSPCWLLSGATWGAGNTDALGLLQRLLSEWSQVEAKASGNMCLQAGGRPCLDVLGLEMREMETFVSGLLCLFYTHIPLGYKHLRFCALLHDLLEFF